MIIPENLPTTWMIQKGLLDTKAVVALYRGDIRNSASDSNQANFNIQYYGGLLSGTTVGKVLPDGANYEGVASATWGGIISGFFGTHSSGDLVGSKSGIITTVLATNNSSITDTNFQLEVNFVDGTV